MGIKEYIKQKKCKTCGVLIPSSWKYCRLHTPKIPKSIKYTILNSRNNIFNDLVFKCDREKALQSDTLIYDENMEIIGYKKPIFSIKV